MSIDIFDFLDEHTTELEDGDEVKISRRNSEEAEVEIMPSKVENKPPPRLRSYSLPILHTTTSQYPVIAEHTTASGLVVPDSRTLPATSLQKPVEALPISMPSASAIEILNNLAVFKHYRPYGKWRDELVNRIIACDVAEVLLNMLAIQGSPELQKYFANGGGADVIMEIFYGCTHERFSINSGRLWNIRSIDASIFAISLVDNRGNIFNEVRIDLKKMSDYYNYAPLLSMATIYNNQDESQLEKNIYEMAMRICDDFSIDPAEYPSKKPLPFGDKAIQYSALSNQNIVEGGVPFKGKGGGTRYCLQKRPIHGGNEYVYVPVSPLAAHGCPLTRLSYVPPEESLFFRQDEILRNDGRHIFMTSQLDFAFKAASCVECIVTTAWRLECCLDEDGVLPWAIFKGKVIYYLLIVNSEPNDRKREFEMAMRICAKLKSAGSAHPKVITVIDGQIGDVVHEENSFWKLRNYLGIEEADMGNFPDLDEPPELPGGPTAIAYIKLKNFMLVLGEPKAGKTWMSLLLACRMAFNQKAPKAVVYFYGEGEKYELEERLEIVKDAWCSASNTTDGEVAMVNLNDRNWGEEGFDLKRKEHQVYFEEKLKEIKAHLQYPLEAIILDNYASIMGKNQEGNNAIKLLEFIKKFQRQGLAVLLACHTNSKFEVAGSIQLPRRTNGIIRLTRKSLWQEELKQEIDAAFKKAGGKIDPLTALDNAFEEALEMINEEEDSRKQINLHVSFSTFRGETPPHEEITINISEKIITATIVDKQHKTDFLNEYYDKLLEKLQKDDESTDEDGASRSQKTVTTISAQPQQPSSPPPSPYTFDDIKSMGIEDQKAALGKVVGVCNVKTRPGLAEALKISEDMLKNFMKGRIRNEEIGLQDKAGRPSKMV